MRSFIAIAMAAALSACATEMPADRQATVMNTVYIAGDHSAPVQPTALPAMQQPAEPTAANDSSLRRLYFYLSGH